MNGDLLADEAPHVIGGVKAFKYCTFSLLSRNVVEGYCKEVFLFLCCKSSSILEGSKPTHWFCEKNIWQDLQWTRFFTTHFAWATKQCTSTLTSRTSIFFFLDPKTLLAWFYFLSVTNFWTCGISACPPLFPFSPSRNKETTAPVWSAETAVGVAWQTGIGCHRMAWLQPWKLTAGTPNMQVDGSDDFPDIKWVILCFQAVHFQGV